MDIELNLSQTILISIYLLINIIAFAYIGVDKAKAINKKRRIPEAHLLFLAIMFCSLGTLLGMLIFRHKTRKVYFFFGVPIALIGNISTLYLLYFSFLK